MHVKAALRPRGTTHRAAVSRHNFKFLLDTTRPLHSFQGVQQDLHTRSTVLETSIPSRHKSVGETHATIIPQVSFDA